MRQLMLRAVILAMRDYRKTENLARVHQNNTLLFEAFKKRCIKLKQIEIYARERLSRCETDGGQVIYVDFTNKRKVA